MGRPIGESFTVIIDGEERTYHIKPRVFSDDTRDALCRLKRRRVREQRFEELADIQNRQTEGTLDTTVANLMIAKVSESIVGEPEAYDFEKSLQVSAEMLQTREGKIAALVRNCEEIHTPAEAAEVVDAQENPIDLFALLMKAGSEGLEAAKNLDPPPQGAKRDKKRSDARTKKPSPQSSPTPA